ncbi:MAG TPA: HPP family protein [Methylococcaceae bacterium]|nr:HPP family protein [Methylococcaceae bacterium]
MKKAGKAVLSLVELSWSWLGGFVGMGAVGYAGQWLALHEFDRLFLIGSFGASAILLYGAPTVPYSQPRNVLGGHILSALVGVAVWQHQPGSLWLTGALAVSCSMAAMQITRTLHPPGGATALIAVAGDSRIHDLGYLYALAPVGLGAAIMLLVALVVNNAPPSRRYPLTWW